MVTGQKEFGTELTESPKEIKGYVTKDSDKTIIIGTGENLIIFTYSKVKPVEPEEPTITTSTNLMLYKVDQDYNFLEGANFKLVKEDGTVINPIKGKAKFEFKDLTDGNYKVVETTTPKGYEGIEEFNIMISDGLMTCPEYDITEPFETLTIENTNDGSTPDVLGDEIDEETYGKWELGDQESHQGQEEVVKTSDDQNIVGYLGLSLISAFMFFVLRRKVKHS